MSNTIGFLMTLSQAEEFFKRCKIQNAQTVEERIAVLNQMAEERRVFPQTEEQVKKRLTGKGVLHVRHKRPDPE